MQIQKISSTMSPKQSPQYSSNQSFGQLKFGGSRKVLGIFDDKVGSIATAIRNAAKAQQENNKTDILVRARKGRIESPRRGFSFTVVSKIRP